MNTSIYILSFCEKKNNKYSMFRLRGTYFGGEIQFVYIENLEFELNKEYVVKIYDMNVSDKILYAKSYEHKEIIHLC